MRHSVPNRTMDEFNADEDPERIGGVAVHGELAHELGYQSFRQMMEQTELVPLPSGSYVYLTTDSDDYWVAWSDKPLCDIQRFDSRQAAFTELRYQDDIALWRSEV